MTKPPSSLAVSVWPDLHTCRCIRSHISTVCRCSYLAVGTPSMPDHTRLAVRSVHSHVAMSYVHRSPAHVHAYTYTHMHTHTHTCIHIHIHAYTYTHAYTPSDIGSAAPGTTVAPPIRSSTCMQRKKHRHARIQASDTTSPYDGIRHNRHNPQESVNPRHTGRSSSTTQVSVCPLRAQGTEPAAECWVHVCRSSQQRQRSSVAATHGKTSIRRRTTTDEVSWTTGLQSTDQRSPRSSPDAALPPNTYI